MDSKKPLLIVLIILTASCLCLGTVGLLENRKNSKPNDKPQRDYQVTYKYYLNDVEVAQMPTNATMISEEEESSVSSKKEEMDVEKLYAFNTYKCTNNVTGTWNDTTWTFTHSNTADATCSLYFVTTYNTVKIEVTNAKIESQSELKVNRAQDAVIKIIPNEGYVFDEASCTNNEVVDWDKDAKELIVRSVTLETTCIAKFKMSKFTVETQVTNGAGSTKVEYEYGKKVDITTVPAEEYGNPEIVCTNEQKGTWKDDVFTIEKLTNDTKCAITFKKVQTKVSFTVSIDVGTHGTLESGASSTVVLAGASASWTVRAKEGYIINADPTCTAGTVVRSGSNPYVIKLENVTADAECTVNYYKLPESTSTQTGNE